MLEREKAGYGAILKSTAGQPLELPTEKERTVWLHWYRVVTSKKETKILNKDTERCMQCKI